MLRTLIALWLISLTVLHADNAFLSAQEEPSAFYGGDAAAVSDDESAVYADTAQADDTSVYSETPQEDEAVTYADDPAGDEESVIYDDTPVEDDDNAGIIIEGDEASVTEVEPQNVRHLYTTVTEKPERLFKGEIFSITLRSIVTTEAFQTLKYRFDGGTGVKLLSNAPERDFRDHAYFDRFYFKTTGRHVVLPDITPYLTFGSGSTSDSEPIKGTAVDVTVLNPPKDFCGILADHFTITHTKTTVYDKHNNIIVFMAEANRTDLGDFTIPSAVKQNFESLSTDPHSSSMTYYAVLPDTVETLHFQYFNLTSQHYDHISIPIKVDADVVSTMSDLKPVEHGHDYQKTIVFSIIAIVFVLLAYWKRSWLLFILAVAAAAYAAWLSVPLKAVCIEKGAPIYLLPMHNATVFEIAPRRYELEAQGHIPNYTKVKLLNNKIGWVKDEDICAR